MKISLTSQIAEIDRELAQRRSVYPRLVAKGSMRQSLADLQIKHLEAVRETLVWLQENERTIKTKLATGEALKLAVGHIEHMAAWITKQNAGYSFESLGEDMPVIRAASEKQP